MLSDVLKIIIAVYPRMTVRQVSALMVMHATPEMKLRDIAAVLKIHRSAVSRIWDALGIYGLMRRSCGIDERDVHGTLTAKGEKLCQQLEEKL